MMLKSVNIDEDGGVDDGDGDDLVVRFCIDVTLLELMRRMAMTIIVVLLVI